MKISMVKAARFTECKDVEVADFFAATKSGRWRKPIEAIRLKYNSVLLETKSRQEARAAVDELKKKLPAVTLSGRFSHRAADGLICHSGIYCADLDLLGSQIKAVRKLLQQSLHLYACFVSPSGDGLKALLRISDDPERHGDSLRAVAKHIFELTGATIDGSCSDVSRLCFVSYDPDIYVNEDAVAIAPLPAEPKPERESNVLPDISLRQQIAVDFESLGAIDWNSDIQGFLACPGGHLHTTGKGPRDCRISLDGTPTLFCFHTSCGGLIDELNHELRLRIAKAEGFDGSDGFAEENIVDEPDEEAPPFPLHCLPPRVKAMAEAVDATERVPASLTGVCGLGILSASIGSRLVVQSGKNRITRGNLMQIASAESGSGKSESYRHMARPFQQFELERIERWKEQEQPEAKAKRDLLGVDLKNWKQKFKLLGDDEGEEWKKLSEDERKTKKKEDEAKRAKINEEVKRLQLEQQELESRLHTPTLSCEDVTNEKLADLLSKNDEQMSSMSSDALSIVNILQGRYNKLDRTDESLYLKAFSGDPCVVHRMSREPIYLKAPCLSALWLTQPDKMQSLLDERSLNEGGLIPRILACHTNCEPREIGKNPPEIPVSVEKDYAALIFILLDTYRLAYEIYLIWPTPEALALFNDHHDAIVIKRRGELRDVTAYAARWNEQAWRIAVCLHAGIHGGQAHTQPLSIETAQNAIEIADWFAAEQLRILNAGRMQPKVERLEKLKKLIVQQYDGEATLRDLQRRNNFKSDEVRQLAARFHRLLVIEKRQNKKGGPPSEVVTLRKR
jgi:Protein of unknown function (DUF3987)/BT4734-like, N-terminal domain